jgi:glutamate synthase domain-containing protein 3
LHGLLEVHAAKASSTLAASMLAHWPCAVERFVRLTPKPQA